LRVVDSLELAEEKAAVGAGGHKGAVAAGRLEPIKVAHSEIIRLEGRWSGIGSGYPSQ
jgi:hypothetical protein